VLARLFSRTTAEERRIRAWSRKTFGVTPRNLPLWRQALRHSSANTEEGPELPNNERLEFLGDAVLDAVIGELLFTRYPDQGEGFLTRMRSMLVSRHQLNILARKVEIERVMESNLGRHQETSVPGNALEAVFGALFLDKGFEKSRKAIVRLLDQHFDLKSIEQEDRDSKSRLLEWGQKKRRKVEFQVSEEHGRGGRGKTYLCEVKVDGDVRGTGRGQSKKKAEQEAAQAAFRAMRHREGGHHHREGGKGDGARRERPREGKRPNDRNAERREQRAGAEPDRRPRRDGRDRQPRPDAGQAPLPSEHAATDDRPEE
jgi:ribonuclease-3